MSKPEVKEDKSAIRVDRQLLFKKYEKERL